MRLRKASPQTLLVLQALLVRAADWRHGYDLTKDTGVKAGTLYPVLMRLADQGLLESEWHPPGRPGAPPRHAYRLTRTGLAYALESTGAAAPAPGRGAVSPA